MRSGPRRSVRILVIGDRGVGKTSLILSLVSEEFPEDVPSKAEEITIPADVIPEMVPTHIVDYSASEQSDEDLVEEVRRADVVCLVYSVEEEGSLGSVTTRWLPLIRSSLQGRPPSPIILVGNKVDLIEDTTLEAAEEIMEVFPEIESFVECSAKNLKNISEMFYYAQKAVLHPTAPVYITDKQDLTEDCKKALTRIFRVCDLDNDGLLNDYELNSFQKRCFDMPLRPDAMEDVKAVLRRNIPGGVSPTNYITLAGFLYLHCLFIQRGRSHTTWTVLRKFGYNENLLMDKEFLYPPLKTSSGSSTELSHKGQQFLTKLFLRFDKDRDGALSPAEVKEMFQVCPSVPWKCLEITDIVPTNHKGWITLHGFLCFWNLMSVYNVNTTLEYLAYFGYPITDHDNQLSAIHVTRERKLDLLKKQSTRNVYICHVVGALGVGKTSVCRALLGHTTLHQQPSHQGGKGEGRGGGSEAGDKELRRVSVLQVYGQEKYLIMREIEVRSLAEPLNHTDTQCDVLCLVYDVTSPKTFEYIARIYMKYFLEKSTPILIVANKIDEAEVRQDYLVQPAVFCDAHRLPSPHPFSCAATRPDLHQLFQKLATMAAFPHLTELSLLNSDSLIWKAGFGIAVVAALGLIVSKLVNRQRR